MKKTKSKKSPPGPRDMMHEHRFINTFSGVNFEEEAIPSVEESRKAVEEVRGEEDEHNA